MCVSFNIKEKIEGHSDLSKWAPGPTVALLGCSSLETIALSHLVASPEHLQGSLQPGLQAGPWTGHTKGSDQDEDSQQVPVSSRKAAK